MRSEGIPVSFSFLGDWPPYDNKGEVCLHIDFASSTDRKKSVAHVLQHVPISQMGITFDL